MRWTLVTGGAVGLGAEICRALAQVGRNIAIHYRKSKKQAQGLQQELEGYGIRAEIIYGDFSEIATTEEFCADYLARFAETDALVNNVGNYLKGSAASTSPHAMRDLMQINTIAPLMLVQALLTSLKKWQGHIVNIGMAGTMHAEANVHATAYNMTKLALTMLTKSLAKELAPHAVWVNMVSPGYLENSVELPSIDIPAGRLARCAEVAEAVAYFMASDYITGQNLEVAGGVRL